jgi:hypothetical protein
VDDGEGGPSADGGTNVWEFALGDGGRLVEAEEKALEDTNADTDGLSCVDEVIVLGSNLGEDEALDEGPILLSVDGNKGAGL